jgi:hypothetical protein
MRRFIAIKAQKNGKTRTEKLRGQSYTVVPVVALVEGTLQGLTAEGPELALAEEFGRFVSSWNGRPVVMNHPLDDDGNPVSANSPQVLEDHQLGFIFNASMTGKKLTCEAWIAEDAKDLSANAAGVIEALEANETVEVSTSYWCQLEETPGTFGDEEYIAIQRNIVPDHLAFLELGTVGACSVADGCGARMNGVLAAFSRPAEKPAANCSCGGDMPAQQTPTTTTPTTPVTPTPAESQPRSNNKGGIFAAALRALGFKNIDKPIPEFNMARLAANLLPDGMMDEDVRALLCEAIEDSKGPYCYLVGFTNDKVVYSCLDLMDYDYDYYQCSYSIEGTTVTLGDDDEEVVLTTTITVVQQSQEPTMPQATPTTQTAPAVTANEPTTPNPPAPAPSPTPAPAPAPAPSPAPGPTPTTVQTAPQTLEQYIASAPREIQSVLNSSLAMHKQHKDGLIAQLKGTGRCKFNDQQLGEMEVTQLEMLAELAAVPTFQGRQLPQRVNAENDENTVPAPPRMFNQATGQFNQPPAQTQAPGTPTRQ